jgi:hypothetical protein
MTRIEQTLCGSLLGLSFVWGSGRIQSGSCGRDVASGSGSGEWWIAHSYSLGRRKVSFCLAFSASTLWTKDPLDITPKSKLSENATLTPIFILQLDLETAPVATATWMTLFWASSKWGAHLSGFFTLIWICTTEMVLLQVCFECWLLMFPKGVESAFYCSSKVFTLSFHRYDIGFYPGKVFWWCSFFYHILIV